MSRLHAQAYAFDGPGFYFESVDEYAQKYDKAAKRGFEEFEIQFIDGDQGDAQLFEALKITQGEVESWYNDIEPLQDWEKATLYYLVENGYSREQALDMLQDGDRTAQQGTMRDYVASYIDDIGGVEQLGQKNLEMYFDYESFGRDIRLSGGDDTDQLQEQLDEANENGDEDEAERIQEQINEIEAMSDRDYGYQVADDLGWDGIGEANLIQYFDEEAFARDIELNGDRSEFEFAGETWTAPSY